MEKESNYFERFLKSLPIFYLLCEKCHVLKRQMKEGIKGLCKFML